MGHDWSTTVIPEGVIVSPTGRLALTNRRRIYSADSGTIAAGLIRDAPLLSAEQRAGIVSKAATCLQKQTVVIRIVVTTDTAVAHRLEIAFFKADAKTIRFLFRVATLTATFTKRLVRRVYRDGCLRETSYTAQGLTSDEQRKLTEGLVACVPATLPGIGAADTGTLLTAPTFASGEESAAQNFAVSVPALARPIPRSKLSLTKKKTKPPPAVKPPPATKKLPSAKKLVPIKKAPAGNKPIAPKPDILSIWRLELI